MSLRLKGLRRALPLLLLLVTTRTLSSQDQPASDTAVVLWAQLSEKPQLRDFSSAGLRYPAAMRVANIAGDVSLILVIDEEGRPVANLTRFSGRSHDLFASQLRFATPQWQFTPATVAGRPVRAEVPVTTTFALPSDPDVPVREISSMTTDSAGVHIAIGWDDVPKEATTSRDTVDVKWAKLTVLMRLLSMNPNVDTLAKTCVRWNDKPRQALPPEMMRRIRAQYDAVNADACPRTISVTVPRGHVNPVWVTVGAVEPWTPDIYVVQAFVADANSTTKYHCEARRDERGRWEGACELRSTTMY